MAQIGIVKRGGPTGLPCRGLSAASSPTAITGGKVPFELLAAPPPDADVIRKETISNREETLATAKSRGYLPATNVVGCKFIGSLNGRSLICAAHYEPQRSGFARQMAVAAAPRWSRLWNSTGETETWPTFVPPHLRLPHSSRFSTDGYNERRRKLPLLSFPANWHSTLPSASAVSHITHPSFRPPNFRS
jgi:hypothetical protein